MTPPACALHEQVIFAMAGGTTVALVSGHLGDGESPPSAGQTRFRLGCGHLVVLLIVTSETSLSLKDVDGGAGAIESFTKFLTPEGKTEVAWSRPAVEGVLFDRRGALLAAAAAEGLAPAAFAALFPPPAAAALATFLDDSWL